MIAAPAALAVAPAQQIARTVEARRRGRPRKNVNSMETPQEHVAGGIAGGSSCPAASGARKPRKLGRGGGKPVLGMPQMDSARAAGQLEPQGPAFEPREQRSHQPSSIGAQAGGQSELGSGGAFDRRSPTVGPEREEPVRGNPLVSQEASRQAGSSRPGEQDPHGLGVARLDPAAEPEGLLPSRLHEPVVDRSDGPPAARAPVHDLDRVAPAAAAAEEESAGLDVRAPNGEIEPAVAPPGNVAHADGETLRLQVEPAGRAAGLVDRKAARKD